MGEWIINPVSWGGTLGVFSSQTCIVSQYLHWYPSGSPNLSYLSDSEAEFDLYVDKLDLY